MPGWWNSGRWCVTGKVVEARGAITMGILEFLSGIPSPFLIPVVAIVMGISAGIIISVTAIVSAHIRRYRERALMANLIHEMVERGMSAEEIERLVAVSAIQSQEDLAESARCH